MAAMRRSFDAFLNFSLASFDFLSVYMGYLFSYFFYEGIGGHSPQDLSTIAQLALVPASLCVVSFFVGSVYRCQPGPVGLDQLRRLLSAYFWSALLSVSVSFFTKFIGFSRIMAVSGFLL